MSVKCQKRTRAPQQTAPSFDHLLSEDVKLRRDRQPKGVGKFQLENAVAGAPKENPARHAGAERGSGPVTLVVSDEGAAEATRPAVPCSRRFQMPG
jgi:hypothetical protein